MKRKELQKLVEAIKHLRETAPDETALDSIYAYAEWKPNTEYSVGDRIRYGENLYRCVQSHTSQDSWTPDLIPALWARISIEEWPEWVQPTGVQDTYMQGDKVTHNSKHWISTADNNVWEPGVYGWDEVVGE